MSIRSTNPEKFQGNRLDQGRTATHELRRIKNKLTELITAVGGGGGIPAGLATEVKQDDNIAELVTANATLNSILSNIINSQDVEILLVRDTGNANQIVQQIREYDQGTGLWNTSYEDVNGAAYVPVGPLEYVDASVVLNLVLTELQAQGLTLDSIEENTKREAWTTVIGNSIAYTYYAGVTPANPSGAANLETAVHSDGGGVVYTQTFSYNANNEVVSIVVS